MKTALIAAFAGCALIAAPQFARAQESAAADVRPKDVQTTVEYYYRIRWGSIGEFVKLYEKNHAPVLEEARKAGFILSTKTEFPFTHMAGGVR